MINGQVITNRTFCIHQPGRFVKPAGNSKNALRHTLDL